MVEMTLLLFHCSDTIQIRGLMQGIMREKQYYRSSDPMEIYPSYMSVKEEITNSLRSCISEKNFE
jgi:hypothetical protein